APTWQARAMQSSMEAPSIGTKGTTSTAPIRGCSPWCERRSMRGTTVSKRASTACRRGSASPTAVRTLRLWSLSDWTSSTLTPGVPLSAAAAASMTSPRRPSLMLGTHSISLIRPLLSRLRPIRVRFFLNRRRLLPIIRPNESEASAHLTGTAERVPELLARGRELLARDRGREAADVFGRVLLLEPGNPEARQGLGCARSLAVEEERALAAQLDDAARALDRGETDRAAVLAGDVLARGGDRDRAALLLDRIDPRSGVMEPARLPASAAPAALPANVRPR